MMPDLGRYALEVTLAYGLSLGLIGALVGWVWLRGRAIRRQLDKFEERQERRNG